MENNYKKCPYCLSFFKNSDFSEHLKKEREEEAEYKRKILNGKYNFGYTSLLKSRF